MRDVMAGPAAQAIGTLSWNNALLAAALLVVAALLAGVVVLTGRWLFARKAAESANGQPDGDFIRSWIAVTLVISLVAFCAFTFAVNDPTLRSTLTGGLIASV